MNKFLLSAFLILAFCAYYGSSEDSQSLSKPWADLTGAEIEQRAAKKEHLRPDAHSKNGKKLRSNTTNTSDPEEGSTSESGRTKSGGRKRRNRKSKSNSKKGVHLKRRGALRRAVFRGPPRYIGIFGTTWYIIKETALALFSFVTFNFKGTLWHISEIIMSFFTFIGLF